MTHRPHDFAFGTSAADPHSRRLSGATAAVDRRTFLTRARTGTLAVTAAFVLSDWVFARVLGAQGAGAGRQSAASNVEMTADSYKPVRRPAKPNAVAVMDDKQLDAFERTLACPCPCTLDIFTCRTTDFTCGISPAVHRDLQALVAGGYDADEIMSALSETYGDFILLAPRKQGFSLLAWFAPFAAVGVGAVVLGGMLRRWRRNAEAAAQVASDDARRDGRDARPVEATSDELAKLEAALRDDSQ